MQPGKNDHSMPNPMEIFARVYFSAELAYGMWFPKDTCNVYVSRMLKKLGCTSPDHTNLLMPSGNLYRQTIPSYQLLSADLPDQIKTF